MTIIAGVITFIFTALLTIAGVGAAFILIPVFFALGVEVHTAMATALLLNAIAMSVASVKCVASMSSSVIFAKKKESTCASLVLAMKILPTVKNRGDQQNGY